MKKVVFFLTLSVQVFTGCNDKKNPGTSADGAAAVKEAPPAASGDNSAATEALKSKTETLQSLTPLAADQLKALLPVSFMGGVQKSAEANTANSYTAAQAEYEINDTTRLTLIIRDCGGPAGAGLFNMQYLNQLNVQKDDDEEYVKVTDFKGGKAIENCLKKIKECRFIFFTSDRLLVNIEGKNISIESVKQAAANLPLVIK